MESILGLVTSMLADPKLEVAQLAALSLSGLLKALPASSTQALRKRYLDTAHTLKPTKRTKLSGAAPGEPFCLMLNGCKTTSYAYLTFGLGWHSSRHSSRIGNSCRCQACAPDALSSASTKMICQVQ